MLRPAPCAWDACSNATVGIDMSWKDLPSNDQRAVNDAMTEFGTGPAGARNLLELVRSGKRLKPSTLSDDVLRIYRDQVLEKVQSIIEPSSR